MSTQKIPFALRKSAKLSFTFNTNHMDCTHRLSNAIKVWNNSLGKVVNLFSERALKYKKNNPNLCHKLEGSSPLLIIWVRVYWISIRVPTCKIQLKNKSVCQSTIQVKFNSTPWLKQNWERKKSESGKRKGAKFSLQIKTNHKERTHR